MRKGKSSISQASTYSDIGDFWDTHDLADHWEQTAPVNFEIDLRSTATYYPLESKLASKLRSIAERRGVSAETLLNLWVLEKTREETSPAQPVKYADDFGKCSARGRCRRQTYPPPFTSYSDFTIYRLADSSALEVVRWGGLTCQRKVHRRDPEDAKKGF
jgi:hypothetical protein